MTYGTSNDRRRWRQTKHGGSDNYRQGFALVEKMFWLYKTIKEQVDYIRESQRERSLPGGGFEQVPHGNSNESYIERMVEQLQMPIPHIYLNKGTFREDKIIHPELWIQAVERTLEILSADDEAAKEVLIRRYFENEDIDKTCADLGIKYNKDFGYNVYYRKRDYGIQRGRECAIQLGIIKVF